MNFKTNLYPIICLLLGLPLMGMSIAGLLDEFWSGSGTALVIIGVIRLLRNVRLNKSETYREKMEVEATDERIHFIRNKAWAWAGYLFIIITSLAVITLKILNQDLYALAASYAVCFMMVLYWICFAVLRKKY